jgi:hypothetical protein
MTNILGELITCVFPIGEREWGPPFALSVPLVFSLMEPLGFEAVLVQVVTLLSHCCYTFVMLLLYCCYTVVTLLLHCCNTVVTLLLHCWYNAGTLLVHCWYTVVALLLHCCDTDSPSLVQDQLPLEEQHRRPGDELSSVVGRGTALVTWRIKV